MHNASKKKNTGRKSRTTRRLIIKRMNESQEEGENQSLNQGGAEAGSETKCLGIYVYPVFYIHIESTFWIIFFKYIVGKSRQKFPNCGQVEVINTILLMTFVGSSRFQGEINFFSVCTLKEYTVNENMVKI